MRAGPRHRGLGGVTISDFVHQSHYQCFRRRDDAAGEAEVFAVCAAHSSGQRDGRNGREDTQGNLRLPELRVGSGKDAVTEADHFQSAAKALATHGGQHRHLALEQVRDQLPDVGQHDRDGARQVLLHRGSEREVAPLALKHDGLERSRGPRLPKHPSQSLHRRPVEDVALTPAEGHTPDGAFIKRRNRHQVRHRVRLHPSIRAGHRGHRQSRWSGRT